MNTQSGSAMHSRQISFLRIIYYKDQVVFERDEVTKENGEPYTVFTPYSKRWKAAITKNSFSAFSSEKLSGNFQKSESQNLPSLLMLGFEHIHIDFDSFFFSCSAIFLLFFFSASYSNYFSSSSLRSDRSLIQSSYFSNAIRALAYRQ